MESIKIKNFQEFINENYDKFDLSETIQRFYMLVNKKAMQETENPLGVMIRDVRDMLFDQQEVSLANYKSLPIQPRIPIINFTPDADIVRKMIEEKIIDEDVLYNKPVQTELVSDKVIFHQVFNGSKYIPKTVFSVEEAETLNFPIVAKPKSGKSAEGIQKFDTIDELKSSPEKFDLFCEAIDIKFEFRCFCFREDMLEINERIELKGEGDFLKDVKTKTAFYYKKLNIEKFKHLQKLRDLVDECRKFIDLDFFSIDFAMDDSGDMYLIEMNARTGMGVDKMIELYTILHKDFYKNNINTIAETKFDELSGIWKERYEEEKGIDECLTVAGKIDKSMFLFKNRDRSYLPDNKVVVEKVGNTEIAFYTDETNWIEGMNEHGVGFVFSMLSTKEHPGYGPSWYVTDKPKRKGLFEKFKEGVKKILSAKNVEDAIKLLEKSKKSGSFLIGDMKHI